MESVFFKRVTMKFICILDRFLFLSYTKDVTFMEVSSRPGPDV